jgi:hypothetical protein
VGAGVTLTIEPGVVVKGKFLTSLFVAGKLVADGTTANPVYFTSYNDDTLCGDTNENGSATVPAIGDWGWIEFSQTSDPTSVIRRAAIYYGGQDQLLGSDFAAVIRLNQATPLLEQVTLAHNYRNGAQLLAGNWLSHTLASTSVIYWLQGDLVVQAANSLTIAPGVQIKAETFSSLYVAGRLVADGTAADPVILTSDADDTVCGVGVAGEPICDTNSDGIGSVPAIGDWGWIEFMPSADPTSILDEALIRYGGQDQLLGSDFRAVIRLNGVSPTLANLSLEKNYRNAAELMAGNWGSNVLTSTSVIYWLLGDLTILESNTLAIEPGVKVKAETFSSLYVAGELVAEGNEADLIVFTSDADDTICGVGVAGEPICDTNSDGIGSVPTIGDWGWIEFRPTAEASSVVRRAVLRYGGVDQLPGSDYRSVLRLDRVSPTLEHISFESNVRNAAELITGSWTTDALRSDTVIYWLLGDIVVLAGNTLTLEPGVKVKAESFSSLYINGKLVADGSETDPIVFTSDADDSVCGVGAFNEAVCDTNSDGTGSVPAIGDWGWVQFQAGSDPTSVIRRALFRYSGLDQVGGSDVAAAIRLDRVSPTLEYISFQDNFLNAAELMTGYWTTTRIASTSVVYWLFFDLALLENNTLMIEPGVIVKAAGSSSLLVSGKLLAEGTVNAPIVFTSDTDDTVCGRGAANELVCDTNNDGSGSTPAPGNWGWIEFRPESDPTSSLRYANLRFGGTDGGDSAALRLVGASPRLAYSILTENQRGIEASDAAPELSCNDIFGNAAEGIRNLTPGSAVQAQGHWWGSASGPMHATNPGGTGEAVSDGVIFAPWALSSCAYGTAPLSSQVFLAAIHG